MSSPIQVFPPSPAPKTFPDSLTLFVGVVVFFAIGAAMAVQF